MFFVLSLISAVQVPESAESALSAVCCNFPWERLLFFRLTLLRDHETKLRTKTRVTFRVQTGCDWSSRLVNVGAWDIRSRVNDINAWSDTRISSRLAPLIFQRFLRRNTVWKDIWLRKIHFWLVVVGKSERFDWVVRGSDIVKNCYGTIYRYERALFRFVVKKACVLRGLRRVFDASRAENFLKTTGSVRGLYSWNATIIDWGGSCLSTWHPMRSMQRCSVYQPNYQGVKNVYIGNVLWN